MIAFPFEHTYGQLPERFFARTLPSPVAAPKLIWLNRPLAVDLGLDLEVLASDEGVAFFAGNKIAEASDPIAMAYAGHQFGQFVPQLGDGRAILLGEVIDCFGQRRDIQLKGPGRTPYSRGGDGRAALGPVLRETIVSEAMAALGIPTTRSLAAVLSGERVIREQLLPGAILTRVAASHIRIGTFQFFAARRDVEGIRALADYVIARHYPQLKESASPYLALLDQVLGVQAALIAQWMSVGFIHGVMNTDNMSISGETIDYGPCAFLDAYDPQKVFSSIDRGGRYAFGNQGGIAGWNLARLAETLMPLISEDQDQALILAQKTLDTFDGRFEDAYLTAMRKKLGLFTSHETDPALITSLSTAMAENEADFTLTFRYLSNIAADVENEIPATEIFKNFSALENWVSQWRQRLAQEPQTGAERAAAMRGVNPAYIPRNHRIEAVIKAAVEDYDFAPFEELQKVLSQPYVEQAAYMAYAEPPQPHERVLKTFCGT
jgi:uncharacterized protein YdiU (UPF0061 family)